MNWQLYLNFTLALLALINPITRLPLWKKLTGDANISTRKTLAIYVILTALAILLTFLFAGPVILNFFGVDRSVFKFGGGILLLISGISMVNGSMAELKDREEEGDSPQVLAKQRFKKVFVPLAFPLLAGPGSITTVIIYGSKSEGLVDYAMLSAVVVLTFLIIYLFFSFSNIAEKRVDDMVFSVLIRVFGILVVAIGSQFILEGLGEVFPAFLEAAGESDIEDEVNTSEGSEQ